MELGTLGTWERNNGRTEDERADERTGGKRERGFRKGPPLHVHTTTHYNEGSSEGPSVLSELDLPKKIWKEEAKKQGSVKAGQTWLEDHALRRV